MNNENNFFDFQSEKNYFAWVIGYECLDFLDKNRITECDLIYDFCHFVANMYINSDEYKNPHHSSYDMFYIWLRDNKSIEELYNYYFEGKNVTGNE